MTSFALELRNITNRDVRIKIVPKGSSSKIEFDPYQIQPNPTAYIDTQDGSLNLCLKTEFVSCELADSHETDYIKIKGSFDVYLNNEPQPYDINVPSGSFRFGSFFYNVIDRNISVRAKPITWSEIVFDVSDDNTKLVVKATPEGKPDTLVETSQPYSNIISTLFRSPEFDVVFKDDIETALKSLLMNGWEYISFTSIPENLQYSVSFFNTYSGLEDSDTIYFYKVSEKLLANAGFRERVTAYLEADPVFFNEMRDRLESTYNTEDTYEEVSVSFENIGLNSSQVKLIPSNSSSYITMPSTTTINSSEYLAPDGSYSACLLKPALSCFYSSQNLHIADSPVEGENITFDIEVDGVLVENVSDTDIIAAAESNLVLKELLKEKGIWIYYSTSGTTISSSNSQSRFIKIRITPKDEYTKGQLVLTSTTTVPYINVTEEYFEFCLRPPL